MSDSDVPVEEIARLAGRGGAASRRYRARGPDSPPGLLNVQDPADRAARQDVLNNLDPEEFVNIDDEYYALDASVDLDSVMRALIAPT